MVGFHSSGYSLRTYSQVAADPDFDPDRRQESLREISFYNGGEWLAVIHLSSHERQRTG